MLRVSVLIGLTMVIGIFGCSREASEADVQKDDRIEKKAASGIPEYDRAAVKQKSPVAVDNAAEVSADDAAAQAEQDRAQKMFRKQLRDQERARREKSRRLKELLDGVPPEKQTQTAQ